MDLQPSAPYASGSLFPSPSCELASFEDPFPSVDRFLCANRGAVSPGNNSKMQLLAPSFKPGFTSDHSTKPWNSQAISFQVDSARQEQQPMCSYYSPNKIGHHAPSLGTGINLCAQGSASIVTLPEMLRTCAMKLADNDQRKNASPSRFMEKIKGLDQILKKVDNSIFLRKFSFRNIHKDVVKPLDNLYFKSRLQELDYQARANVSYDRSRTVSLCAASTTTMPAKNIHTSTNEAFSRIDFQSKVNELVGDLGEGLPELGSPNTGGKESAFPVANSGPHQGHVRRALDTHAPAALDSCKTTSLLYEILEHINAIRSRLPLRHKKRYCAKRRASNTNVRPGRRLCVSQQIAGKRIVTLLQRNIACHAASIYDRIEKTELAVSKLGQQLCSEENSSSLLKTEEMAHENVESNPGRHLSMGKEDTPGSCVGLNSSCNWRDLQNTLSLSISSSPLSKPHGDSSNNYLWGNIIQMQDQLCSLKNDTLHILDSMKKIQKQRTEQSTEVELCWTAINQLCMDNETFRKELLYESSNLNHEQFPADLGPLEEAAITDAIKEFEQLNIAPRF